MPVSTMGTQNSQEMHSQVLNAILAPIRDLNENWKVDLSAHLETYLRELCSTETGALGSVNFVEAALLIQRSAGIFGKKVEYLWQLLMQVLESVQKKGAPGEKGNERRKRAATVSDLLADFGEIPISIDKKIWKGKAFPVKLEPPYYSELEYNCPREKKLSLFDHMLDPVGDKSDFRLNFAISDSFMLAEELSHVDCGSGIEEIDDMDMLDDDGCTGDDVAMDVDDGPFLSEGGIDVGLSNDINMEISPPLAEPDPEPNIELADTENANPEAAVNAGERIVTVNDNVSWGSVAGDIPDKAMKVQDRCKAPELKRDCDSESVSSLVTNSNPINFGRSAEEVPKFRLEFLKASKDKKKLKEQRRLEEIEEYRRVLATDFTGDFLGFEDYEPSSGEEDGFLGYPEEADQDDNDADAGDLMVAALPAPEPITLPSSSEDPTPLPGIVIPSDTNDWTQVYQNILQEKMHSARVGNQDAQAALATRVNAWHDSIRPKLKLAEERRSMDIHEYGTYVLGKFPQGNAKTTIDFADVVAGVEQEEVCRYFLSTLMLANTYNVHISRTDPDELAMNCIELTLLKSTRHHEALDEYQAPSQRDSVGMQEGERGSEGARRNSKGKGKSTKSSNKSSKSSKR